MKYIMDNLYLLDYFVLVITSLFVLFSIWKGFIQSILGLMTWIGSIIITLIFYQKLSDYLSIHINKIGFLESSGLSVIIATIISIPLIFIICLIILRKFRKIISSDLDKATLGIILDKFFGIIYGFIFSYFIFSLLLFFIEQINSNFILFLNNNSFIFSNIIDINNSYIYQYIPFILENSDSLTN